MKNQIPFPFLGIKNYKLIKENVFDFSEITFLIGPNNCGKSSVLKALQLLRDNFCDPDFKTRNFSKLKFDSKPMSGTYKSCLNSETNDEKMSFMFPCFLYEESLGINMVYDFSIMDEKGYLSTFSVFQEQSQDNFQSIFQINEDFHPEDGYFLRANINYNYFRSKLIEEHKRQIEKYNEIPEPRKGKKYNINNIFELFEDSSKSKRKASISRTLNNFNPENSFFNFEFINNYASDKSETVLENEYLENITEKDLSLMFYNWDAMINYLAQEEIDELFLKCGKEFKMGNGITKIVPTENGRVFFLKVAQMLDIILDDVINRFQNTLHISSAKSDQERIYKDNEKNNLFAKILFDYIDKNGNSNFEYVNKWLNKLKIISDDEQFQVERPADSASVPLIQNSLTGYQRNLIDFGFGTTQIVMFLLVVSTKSNKNKLILLEEPEMNLHPNLQSQLADLLADASREFKIQFIVETHSEYLIRKMQVNIGEGSYGDIYTIDKNDCVLYYFGSEGGSSKSNIKKIEFTSKGGLTDDFGKGFYDEALIWRLELLSIQNHN